jgi:hypothetical protein
MLQCQSGEDMDRHSTRTLWESRLGIGKGLRIKVIEWILEVGSKFVQFFYLNRLLLGSSRLSRSGTTLASVTGAAASDEFSHTINVSYRFRS